MSRELPVIDDEVYRKSNAPPLGSGGFGTTYLATDAAGQRVVIKELHEHMDARFGDRFASEAMLLTRMRHEAIVQVFQFGRWRRSGRLFYSMDYVDGIPLARQVGARRLEDQIENLAVLADVASAMAYAHDSRVVHRDLKPENVLVRGQGSAVVIDWGLAGIAGDPDERQGHGASPGSGALTRAGAGSAFYMSPEQARGRALSPAMDAYAIGAMLYETLCGHPPFKDVIGGAPSPIQARAVAISSTPTPLTGRFDPRLEEIAALATRCLDRDARRRPRITELDATLASWKQRCCCLRCGRIVMRARATRMQARWICSSCGMVSALYAVYRAGVTTVAGPVTAEQRSATGGRPVSAATGTTATTGSTTALVPRAVLEHRADVRSTLATDEFGRSVVIEELREDAHEELRRSFLTAVQVMTAADSTAAPRVLRSSPTMFVREHVTGSTVATWSGKADELVLVGLRGLCELVLSVHARGMVHRGIRLDALIVDRSEGRCALVAVDWRGLMAPSSEVPSAGAMPTANDSAPDTAAVLEIARTLAASSDHLTWLVHEIAIAEGRAPSGDATLHRLMRSIERYVERVTCSGCGDKIRLGAAIVVGNGHVCDACPTIECAVEQHEIEEIDLHLTRDDQLELMAIHRSVHRRRLIALFLLQLGSNLALGLFPLLVWRSGSALAAALYAAYAFGAVITQPAWLTLYFSMLYHRGRAKYYRDKLQQSETTGEVIVTVLSVVGVAAQLLSLAFKLDVSTPDGAVSFVLIAAGWWLLYRGFRGTWRNAVSDWILLSQQARGTTLVP